MGKKIVLWLLTALFAAAALLYLTGLSALAAFGAAVILAPIKQWQDRLGKYVRGAFKAAVVVVLALLVCVTVPLPDRDTADDALPVVSQDELPTDSVADSTEEGPEDSGDDPVYDEEPEGNSTAEPDPTPEPEDSNAETTVEPSGGAQQYILNVSTKKFHYPDCGSAGKMKEENKEYYYGDREDLVAQGYTPCGNCDP